MAAGPNRLATNYLERLDNIEEIVEELDYHLTYAPGWDVLEEMSEWQDIAKGIDNIVMELNYLTNVLETIKENYPDKMYEEFLEERSA